MENKEIKYPTLIAFHNVIGDDYGVEIKIKKDTYSAEIYQITLLLINKLIELNPNKENFTNEDFFNNLYKEYIKLYPNKKE